ncbi:probable sodium/metabolite cotransporter BASS1, chloroplastic isoform X3 [Miscanthus floridulus]|uniref:probable sodium/metabolite cotransporter BASS1, chloroplastic isoform X3 n=1 Tax=Miscanthus floridulus TaxID=154761 RepID=UPI00345980E4
MLLLSPSPPAPAAAVTVPRRILLTPHRRLKATSTPPRLACLRLRPAAPLRGIPSKTGCRAAAADADAAPSQVPGGDGGVRGAMVRIGEALSLGFPVWVASACALALWRPPAFLWVGPTAQMLGLSFTMLGMGMTLTLDDLKTALLMPRELAAGFILQYTPCHF